MIPCGRMTCTLFEHTRREVFEWACRIAARLGVISSLWRKLTCKARMLRIVVPLLASVSRSIAARAPLQDTQPTTIETGFR